MSTSTKAPKAPTANVATPVSAKSVTAFVKAYKAGESSVVAKARIIGESIHSGSTVGKVTETLRNALTEQGLIIPKSFSASVTHYNTAYVAASTLSYTAYDDVLHALYQISTGVVKAAEREAFVTFHATKGSTPEEVVESVRALIAKARADKRAGKPSKDDADESDESDLMDDESVSPLADLKAIVRQAGKIMDLLADNSEEEYAEGVAILTAFQARYLA